jgi:hypothetical protein
MAELNVETFFFNASIASRARRARKYCTVALPRARSNFRYDECKIQGLLHCKVTIWSRSFTYSCGRGSIGCGVLFESL